MSNEFVNTILKDLKINFTQHHFMILKLVGENKRLFVTEIVDILSITKSQMTALVDKLIRLGYISRTNDIDDRRKIYLSLSDEGGEKQTK